MRNKKLNAIILIVVLIITAWVINDTFTQTGIDDLKGGFKEVASYRNENNTGPIQRIYAVTVKDTTNAQLEAYGNLMPHSKYGNTKVYFFFAGSETPKTLTPGDENFDAVYQKNCFARYEKSAMGNVGLIKKPF